jgi:hypothetical protein
MARNRSLGRRSIRPMTDLPATNGPKPPFVNHLGCCDAARHSGLSLQLTYPLQDEREAGKHLTNTISWQIDDVIA